MQRPLLVTALALAFLLPAGVVLAQTSTISGVVRDYEGGPIEGVTVSAESAQYARTAETLTNEAGRFQFIGLQPGRWLFILEAVGFEAVQGFANIRRSRNSGRIEFVMESDPLHPPAPSTGQLAGIRADEIQDELDAADLLFDTGDYTGAIEAYEGLLDRVPLLTSVRLQIGHAYVARRNFDRALEAYQAIPTDDPAAAEATAAIEALELARNAR